MHRYLFVLPSFRTGGAEKVVVRVANSMQRMGLDVVLVAISREGELRGQIAPGITVVDLDVRRTRYALGAIVRLIRRTRPRVVFSTLTRINLLIVMTKWLLPQGTRVVIREAAVPTYELSAFGPVARSFYTFLYRRFYQRADRIVSQSRAMAEDLIANFGAPRERIVVIHNPVAAVEIEARKLQGSPFSGRLNYLAVGRLSPEKGYDSLLAAFAIVLRDLPDARLTILGRGPEEETLRRLAQTLNISGQVEFKGFVQDPYPFYVNADAFVQASLFEGFPNALVEAIASGTPVVATDCPGGTVEIVIPRENGLLVPVSQSNELAAAMIRVLELGRSTERTVIARSVQKFAEEGVFEAYRKLLLDVAKDAGPNVGQ